MQKRSHPEAPLAGKSAPESIHSGSRMMLTMAWKAWVESIGQAMAKPSAVSSKLIMMMTRALRAIEANVGWTPTNGAKTRKTMP